MYLVSLPSKIASGDHKGEDSFVDVKSAKMTDGAGKNVQYKIPAEKFQYPQFGPQPVINKVEGPDGKVTETELPLTEDQAQEGIDEAIKDAGGKIRFLENYNSATRTAALNSGKNYIRTKETGSVDDIINAGLKLSQEFSWAKAERMSNKEVREELENIGSQLETLSADDLKAKLRALLGK